MDEDLKVNLPVVKCDTVRQSYFVAVICFQRHLPYVATPVKIQRQLIMAAQT